MKKQNIFIDFDGTICFDYFWRSAPQNINDAIVKFLFKEHPDLVNDWMRGKHSSEEIIEIIAKNTGLNYNLIWNIFVDDCKNMHISPLILDILLQCNQKNNMFLITDNMDSFNRFTCPQLELNRYFKQIFNSFDFGVLKDDEFNKCLFKKVIDMHGFDIKKSILIDNSPKNCKIFKNLGGTSFQVKTLEDTLSILKMLV